MIALYIDHNPKRAVYLGLRQRGVDVLDTHEDGTGRMEDEALLERAQVLQRVFFTHDKDFLRISARWLCDGRTHLGIIYSGQSRLAEGELIEQLTFIAYAYQPHELQNRVTFLPL